MGLKEIALETAEPSIEGVKAAYPEGTYRFFGRTVSGARIFGEAVLSHGVVPPPRSRRTMRSWIRRM